MATIMDNEEPGSQYDNELLTDVSANELIADAPQDEDEECRRVRRVKNTKRTRRRRNAEARTRNPPHHNLHDAYAAADNREYATPIGNIAEAAIILQRLPQNPETVSHPIYKNINRAIIYAPGSSHAYIQ
jgi:hypothetical protein